MIKTDQNSATHLEAKKGNLQHNGRGKSDANTIKFKTMQLAGDTSMHTSCMFAGAGPRQLKSKENECRTEYFDYPKYLD